MGLCLRNCLCIVLIATAAVGGVSSNHGVFSVKYRYAGRERSLSLLKEHDARRQLRILAGVDLPLGGTSRPDGVGLYYAKIGIGTPPKDYYVQVDTGSDIMWVNCIQCKECPRRSSLGIELTLYDIKDSSTGKFVTCDQEFCHGVYGGPLTDCMANTSCPYLEIYGDGSSTTGYFVQDVVQYDKVSGDLQTTSTNGSLIFGCGARQSGNLDSTNEEALDGIIGFGKSNSSMISQLASSGGVRKMFAHCLDGINGGGIFAIGHVVQPEVNKTPLVPNHVDEGFPNVTFHFENSVSLKVYPHEYLFPFEDLWCIGWQNSGMQSRDRKNMTLLGDLVLSNKLVLYDLENQVIGWTEYNCSSSIKVRDERTGTVHLVGSHYLTSDCSLNTQWCIILLLLSLLLHLLIHQS
ncbi:aspartic proteinase-like protein 2 isoform X3 [Citrus clementina]|uniref:aspartic proteinase-like protein 2 isoform X3 n=1 Tax=Citrus clementina TaxID=85681 RepID=UPI000CED675A|nr:aspartic proteinase-like protein 2 isoform X3 [Citrus x clementina]